MAIAFDTSASTQTSSAGTTLSLSYTAASGANTLVVVTLAFRGTSGADTSANGATVTYGGVQMVPIAGYPSSPAVGNAVAETVSFGLLNPPAGSQTVAATVPNSVQFRMAVQSWTGVQGLGSNTVGAEGTTGTTLRGPGACDSPITGTVLVSISVSSATSGSWSAGTGTARYTVAGTSVLPALLIQEQARSGATTTSTATTPSSTNWTSYVFSMIPTNGGAVSCLASASAGVATANNQILSVSGSSATLGDGQTLTSNVSLSGAQTVAIVYVSASLTTASGTITVSVAYGGTAMTQLDLQQGAASGGNEAIGIYYLFNPPTGAATVTLSVGGTTVKTRVGAVCVTYNNVDSLSAAVNNSNPTGLTESVTVASSTGGRVAAAYVSANAVSPDANLKTFRGFPGAGAVTGTGDFMFVQDTIGATSVTLSATLGSSIRWRAMGVGFVPYTPPLNNPAFFLLF